MKNVITTKSTTMSGDVFFGHASVIIDDKVHKFNVCSFLEVGKKTKFRAITKVKAGWNTITDFECVPENLWSMVGKHTQCVQIERNGHWFDVYNTKGGLWANIDVIMLDACTVGDIHSSAPKMACYKTWNQVGAKTWADKAFVNNVKTAA
jgi:hypothetical protein